MKKRLLLVSAVLLSLQLSAQTQQLGNPVSWKAKVPLTKKKIEMPYVDNAAERQAEAARRAGSYEKNFFFGKEQTVSIDVMQESEVKTLPNGDVLRQLRIHSEGALSLNLIFSEFELKPGARLYLFDKNQQEYIGAHTALNNNTNRVLGTELIHGDELVIELTEPAETAGQSQLVIGTVVHGFLDLEQELKALNDSGDCMYDVNCPIGAGWENQRNSVAMMMNGGGFCTGSLVNNASGSIIPYFISANHCGTNPGGWVFRFRWESPAGQADCATSANSVNGPTTMNVNGGTLRANWSGSDFTLTELNTAPDPAWGIYYAGWDRTDVAATSAVGIHHPSGDIKKISFEYNQLQSSSWSGTPANSHWRTPNWDEGVTEGGSSGSPLYDQNHRFVGQLHGGASACGNSSNNLWDDYGKFSFSWTGNGTNSSRLSNWLDPGNTGITVMDGVDPSGPGVALDAAVGGAQGVTGTYCTSTVTPTVNLTNNGSDALTSATINYGFDGNINQVYNWSGNLAQYQTETITLPSATLAGGSHTFDVNVVNPNGGTDENTNNNVLSSSFTTITNPYNANLSLTLDCYGSEITWEIRSVGGADVYYTGGPYDDSGSGGEVITGSYCLAAGCYEFAIMDEYGDGLTSAGCPSGSGSYSLTDDNATEVAGLTQTQANFGTLNIQQFCLGTEGITSLLQEQWGMYPNPAENTLYVEMADIAGLKQITLLTATGQQVLETISGDGMTSVDIRSLAKGVYFVRLSAEGGTTIKPLIVK